MGRITLSIIAAFCMANAAYDLQPPATAIHVIQPSPGQPGYIGHHVQHQPPIYAPATVIPQQPPPQYTQEAYTKQSPYNPNYGQ